LNSNPFKHPQERGFYGSIKEVPNEPAKPQ